MGKTYSLFGESDSTNNFFTFINYILDELLKKFKKENVLLDTIQNASRRKKNFLKFISQYPVLIENEKIFNSYSTGVNSHLKEQSYIKFWESVMRLKEWQYHLYMMEFALINRMNKNKFLDCDKKIALLPHCLRDLTKECKAAPNGIDYQCKHCSKNCFINETSKLLKEKNIEPYIWMSANLRSIVKNNHSLGVLGIACIPELVRGMRSCQRKGLPVVGLPLDANRCGRWMGNFNPNSINLEILEKLVS